MFVSDGHVVLDILSVYVLITVAAGRPKKPVLGDRGQLRSIGGRDEVPTQASAVTKH